MSCATPAPFTVEDIRGVTTNGRPVICGGYNGESVSDECTVYSSTDDTWDHLATMETQRYFYGAAQINQMDFWITGEKRGLSEPDHPKSFKH